MLDLIAYIHSSEVPNFDEVIVQIGLNTIRPLQDDFKSTFSTTLHEAAEERDALLLSMPYSSFPAEGGVFKLPGLDVHVLRKGAFRQNQAPVDIVVLEGNAAEDRASGSKHVVLSGETVNGGLNFGIVGFELPMRNAREEVLDLVDRYTSFIKPLKEKFSEPKIFRQRLAEVAILRPLEYEDFQTRFIKPNLSQIAPQKSNSRQQAAIAYPYGFNYG